MKAETVLAVATLVARIVLAIARELSGVGILKRAAARRKARNAGDSDPGGDVPSE